MELLWAFDNFSLTSLLDILLVAALIYGASLLVRGTQAVSLLRGTMLVLIMMGLLTSLFQLVALRWLLNHVITGAVFAIPVIFQPELRRALTRLGGTRLFSRQPVKTAEQHIIEQICAATERLAERRHGALIVLERSVSLEEYINTGVRLHSEVTPQLLLTIFWPKTELHDGAAILTGNEIAAAACVLPLSSGHRISERKLGTRHRAALGISEVSDAICVVVSEETGHISVTNGGRMIRRLDSTRLRTILSAFYEDQRRTGQRWMPRWLADLRERLFTRTAG
ncbi:MAG: diadenylate cyclase CdaA [Anaerolineae bacterium]